MPTRMDPDLLHQVFDNIAPELDFSESKLWTKMWSTRRKDSELGMEKTSMGLLWKAVLVEIGEKTISHTLDGLATCMAEINGVDNESSQKERMIASARACELRNNLCHHVQSGKFAGVIQIKEKCDDAIRLFKQAMFTIKACESVEASHHAFLCPIGRHLMLDPVVAADGHTYERSNIEKYFGLQQPPCGCTPGIEVLAYRWNFGWTREYGYIDADGDARVVRSPMTNVPLTSLDLVPNNTLRSLIKETVESFKSGLQKDKIGHPDFRDSPQQAAQDMPSKWKMLRIKYAAAMKFRTERQNEKENIGKWERIVLRIIHLQHVAGLKGTMHYLVRCVIMLSGHHCWWALPVLLLPANIHSFLTWSTSSFTRRQAASAVKLSQEQHILYQMPSCEFEKSTIAANRFTSVARTPTSGSQDQGGRKGLGSQVRGMGGRIWPPTPIVAPPSGIAWVEQGCQR